MDTISASAMPCGPPTCTSFSVTVSSGKKSISGSPRSETSRPVQAAICSPIRVFRASRGTSATSSTKSAAAARKLCRQNPSDALHAGGCPSSRRPGDRGCPRRRQAARRLAHSGRYGNASTLSERARRRRWPTHRSGRPDPRSPAGAPDLGIRGPRQRGAPGARFADYDALHAWSVERSRRLLGPRLGFLRGHRREGRAPARRGRRHARDALLPGRAAEFCREPPAAARRRRRRSSSAARTRSSGGSSWDELSRARLAPAAGDAGGGRRRRRPRRGDAAEHAGDDRRHARHRLARRDLLLLLAGFRRARRARPFRADRAKALLRRATAIGTTARPIDSGGQAGGRRRASCRAPAKVVDRPLSRARRGGCGASAARHDARRLPRGFSASAARLRAAALRSPALHPLLVRHDRRAEMHRARRRRHAAAAPEGAPAALLAAAPASSSSTSPPAAG